MYKNLVVGTYYRHDNNLRVLAINGDFVRVHFSHWPEYLEELRVTKHILRYVNTSGYKLKKCIML